MNYVIYCRKSTDTEDKQVLSLDSQESELKHIAEAQGIKVVKIFRESMSAKEEGRPIFNQMIKMIISGKVDAILCWKLDRLARNMIDGGQVMDLLQRSVIKEIRTHESTHLSSDNALMLAVHFGMANQYIRELSANVKRGNRAKLEKGGWPGPAPFGYLNNKLDKTIVVDTDRAKYIQKMFTFYATGGYGVRDISEILYGEGLRTRSGRKVWRGVVHRVLNDPFYMGVMLKNGKYYPGIHEPIISKELFDRVKLVLTGNLHSKKQKHFFHLRGFLRCASCGCMLTATIKKGHDYYYCTNGKGKCDEHKTYLRSEKLEEMVAEALTELQQDPGLVDLAYRAAQERVGHEHNYSQASLESLQNQLKNLAEKQSKLADSYMAEITPEAIYNAKMRILSNEEVVLKQQIKTLQGKSGEGQSTLEPVRKVFLQGISSSKDYLDGTPEEKRILVEELLWNLSIGSQKIQDLSYKSPYNLLAKSPKISTFHEMLPR